MAAELTAYLDLMVRNRASDLFLSVGAPPGIKISTRAFGRDRRMPITNRYRG